MIDAPSSTPAAAADLKRERSVSPSAPDMHVEQETENRHHNNEPARSDSVASHIPCPAAPVNDAVSSVAAPEAKAAPSQTQAPASPAHHELDELSAQLHRGHSSHYAFGNVKQIAVTDHLVMLDGLTMLTGPATGPITPYQTEVRIADNPSPLLVASIWLANLTRPHGRRIYLVVLDNQSQTALVVAPTALVDTPTQLSQPIQPSDTAFASQSRAEAKLIADEGAKAVAHNRRGPSDADQRYEGQRTLRSSKSLV